jgi:hypothetical protein
MKLSVFTCSISPLHLGYHILNLHAFHLGCLSLPNRWLSSYVRHISLSAVAHSAFEYVILVGRNIG